MGRIAWLLKIAFKSLIRRKSRTFLVAASLTLASGLATVFFSFPAGAQLGLGQEFRSYGANLVLSPLAQEAGSTGLAMGQASYSDFLETRKLEEYLRKQPEAKEVSFQIRLSGHYRKQPLVFLGIERKTLLRASSFWKIEGRLPKKTGEALVGSQLAKKLRLRTGEKLTGELKGKKLELRATGLVESGSFEDRALVLDLEELSSLGGLKSKASLVLVRVEPPDKARVLREKIEKDFPEIQARTLEQVIEREKTVVKKVEQLLFLAMAFVLLATSVSIANTTSTTVMERWREIGLLKSLGGSNWLVLKLFLLEASTLAFFSALAGFSMGWFLTELFAFSIFSLFVPFVWWTLPASLLSSFLIVFLSSIWPLRLIFKIEPALVLKGQ